MKSAPHPRFPNCRVRRLERSVAQAKPKPARAARRAEGAAPPVVPAGANRAPSPRLDLDAQIAVVRGRAPGAPSRALLALEDRILGRRGLAPRVSAGRYDPGVPPPAPSPAAGFGSDPRNRFAHSSALGEARFHVESFEETPPVDFIAPHETAPADALPTLDAPWAALPDLQSVQPGEVLQNLKPPPQPEPLLAALPPAVSDALPAAVSLRPRGKAALNGEQKRVAEEFQRDLAAVLGNAAAPPEDRQAARWENALGQAQGQAAAPGPAAAPAAPAAEAHAVRGFGHVVFDNMNLGLSYANSFDLGAIDVVQRFDDLEQDLGLQRPAGLARAAASGADGAPALLAQPAAPDEFDVAADLAEIVAAQVPTPVAVEEAAPPPSVNVPEESRHD
jgi:hypothetical protein